MKRFIITEELLTGIVNYLSTQPFKEVNPLIQAIQSKEHLTEYTEPIPSQPAEES